MDAACERDFTDFVASRSWALLRTARLLTADRHRAEDLVQSALTKLASQRGRVNDPDAYLRLMYHDQVSWWRRRHRVREDPAEFPPDGVVGDDAVTVNRRLALEHALRQLGPRQRAVLVLRYYEDLADQQIADILDCSATPRTSPHGERYGSPT